MVGVLIDIDGVILRGRELVQGAGEAIDWLRRRGTPFLFLTNTSRKPRRAIVESLTQAGLEVEPDEVVSTSVVAARWLRARSLSRLHLLVAEETKEDFAGFEWTETSAEVVVVGDMGRRWSFDILNRGFLSLHRGAALVALQKNGFWESEEGLALDAGAFVAALEYASGCAATVIGKPSRDYFQVALEALGLPAEEVFMIGDDLETDIAGARTLGIRTILVETGKYRGGPTEIEPDRITPSIAELPKLLG